MRVVGALEIEQALYRPATLAAMREAFVLGSRGRVRQPPRAIVDLGEGTGMAFMPGALLDDRWLGAKLVTRFAAGPSGRHAKAGAFLLFDRAGNEMVAIIDGPALTQARTAAATVAATDVLARSDAGIVTLLGTGELARAHLRAFALWPRIRGLRLWGRDAARTQRCVDAMAAEIGAPLTAVHDIEDAIGQADVICTLTSARQPFLAGRWLRPGQHLNAVGSSTPAEQEIDLDAVGRAEVFVDSRAAAAAAAAELRAAVAAGRLASLDGLPEVGEVLTGERPGRSGDEAVTLFKSLGLFAQDCLAARLLIEPMADDEP